MLRRLLILLVGGAIALLLILVGVAAFVFWPLVTSAHTSQPTTVTTTPSTSTITPTPVVKSGNTTAAMVKQYVPAIKDQIAKGLNLSSDQLTTQLKSGKTLSQIATAQGVSTTQLQTLVKNSIETNLKPLVDNGTLTQKQLDALAKRYSTHYNNLDKLLGGKGVKGTKKTGTATPTPTPNA